METAGQVDLRSLLAAVSMVTRPAENEVVEARLGLDLPAAAAEDEESEAEQKWEYVTRASEHVEEGLDTRQDLLNANRHFEQMRKTVTFRFVMPNINMKQPVGSSVLLSVNPNRLRRKVVWKFRNHERELTILEHVSYSNMVSFNSYFRYRTDYDLLTGSLLVTNLELTDGGLYEVILSELTDDKTITSKNVYYYLEVQELLATPKIYQKPDYIVDSVQLICFMQGHNNIHTEWMKNDVSLMNHSHFEVNDDGTMLLIKDLKVSDCGLYICRVHNDVSSNFASRFVSADGILFIVFYAFVMSVVALVSNFTSFIAAFVINFVVLQNSRVAKFHNELIFIFVTFQLLSFICLLIASLLCIYDSAFTTWFRVIAAFGCIFSLTMIIYIAVMFLSPNPEESTKFIYNHQNCLIYILGLTSVLLPCVLLFKVADIAHQCQYSDQLLITRGLIASFVYIFPMLVFVLFYTMHLLMARDPQMKVKQNKRESLTS